MTAQSEAGATQADYEVYALPGAGDAAPGLGGAHGPGPDSVRGAEDSGVMLYMTQTMYLLYVISLCLAGCVSLILFIVCLRRRKCARLCGPSPADGVRVRTRLYVLSDAGASRRRGDGGRGDGGVRGRAAGDGTMALDNKHNLAQREQFYAAVQKGLGQSLQERIPEYPEDISPYATFHVASHVPSHAASHVGSHLYHEQRVAAMETLQLKSVSPTVP